MVLFLHKMGYTFFNLNSLTYPEINSLIEAYNQQERKKEREYERMKRKGANRRRR